MVIVTMRGAFAITDALDSIARQRSDQTWGYGVLVDLRFLKSEPTIDELRRILNDDLGCGADAERRGPLAFVVTDPILYKNACAYLALADSTRPVNVFRCRQDAESWLSEWAGKG